MIRLAPVILIFLWASLGGAQTHIALFDSSLKTAHGTSVNSFLKEKIKKCQTCEILHFDFFDSNGKVDVKKMESLILGLPKSVKIIHFSWNVPFTEKYKEVVRLLNQKIGENVKVVAASGESQDPFEIALPVKETVMGQLTGALLVGELNAKGRLSNSSYFGPEIKISHPTIPGYPGSSFTSLLETAKLALEIDRTQRKDK
jgi:hypothetical protein